LDAAPQPAVHRRARQFLLEARGCGGIAERPHRTACAVEQRGHRFQRDHSRRAGGRGGSRSRREALPAHRERHLPDHAADDRQAGYVKQFMQVLSVASEIYPLVKTGGLADVVGALPLALDRHGIRTKTLVPGYPAIMRSVKGAVPRLAFPDLLGHAATVLEVEHRGLDLLILDIP